jgi:hypothetical protein
MRRITAFAAAAMVGVTAPAAGGVDRGGFDVTAGATLQRSWSWRATSACGDDVGEGRRVTRIRTAAPVAVGRNGGTIAVLGTVELRGVAATWDAAGGTCMQRAQRCPAARSALRGTVRLTIGARTVRLSNLRYRMVGRPGCAPEIDAVRMALRNQPRLGSVVVRDPERKLRNPRIPRVTVRGSSERSAQLVGRVTGDVGASVGWSLVLRRR